MASDKRKNQKRNDSSSKEDISDIEISNIETEDDIADPNIEMHPSDKTGMASRSQDTTEDKHAKSDDAGENIDRTRGSRSEKTDDEPVFESSTQAEEGVMDKTTNEEYPQKQ